MLEDELKKFWKNISEADVQKLDKSMLIVRLDEKLKNMESAIKRRDFLEIAVAVVLIPVFMLFIFFIPSIVSKIGAGFAILYFLLVIYKLRSVKKWKKPVDVTLPLREQLIQSKSYYEAEMNLLDTVLYWYLIPPFIALGLFWAGMVTSWLKFGILMLFAALLFGVIYKLNKDAVNKEFKPLLKRIDDALKRLEE